MVCDPYVGDQLVYHYYRPSLRDCANSIHNSIICLHGMGRCCLWNDVQPDPRYAPVSYPIGQYHHARNWRPQILIITRLRPRSLHDNSREYDVKVEHENLIRFAGQLKKGKGLTVVSALIEGDPTSVDREGVRKSEAMIEQFLAQERINGFTRVGVVTDINVAFATTVQMSGIGSMSPNTFLCEWPKKLGSL